MLDLSTSEAYEVDGRPLVWRHPRTNLEVYRVAALVYEGEVV